MFSPGMGYNFLRYATPIEQGAYSVAPRFARAALGAGAWAATNYAKNRVRRWGKQRTNPYIKKEVKKAVAQSCPKKWVDKTVSGDVASDATQVVHLDVVPQGDGCEERIGRTYTIRSVDVNAIITAGITQTKPFLCKFAIVLDRESNGELPEITDIYEATAPHAPWNKDNAGRFQILAEKQCVISGDGDNPASQTTFSMVPIRLFTRRNIKVTTLITDATGAIENRKNAAVLLVFRGNADGTLDNAPQISAYTRVTFTDE